MSEHDGGGAGEVDMDREAVKIWAVELATGLFSLPFSYPKARLAELVERHMFAAVQAVAHARTRSLLAERDALRAQLAAAGQAVAERDRMREAVADMERRKDGAYEERNRVVALLAALAIGPRQLSEWWSACRSRTAIEGWSDDWHGCVYIETPGGQLSWHYHDSHARLFEHLPFVDRHPWDGHTTEEKYARIEALVRPDAGGEGKEKP